MATSCGCPNAGAGTTCKDRCKELAPDDYLPVTASFAQDAVVCKLFRDVDIGDCFIAYITYWCISKKDQLAALPSIALHARQPLDLRFKHQ